MPDYYILTGQQGSQINLGSYLMADPGPDFGNEGVLERAYAGNAITEGGEWGYESAGPRQFTFPLRLASTSAFAGGLAGAEQWLSNQARPGAYIDLIPEGVATADTVRFDVLGGEYAPHYSVYQQKIARREGTLSLEVQPFGYSPSYLILASAASVALPGQLAVSGASLIGDYPPLCEIVVDPTVATNFPAGSWVPDMVGWSLAGRPSFSTFWPPASVASAITGTLIADAFAFSSQAIQLLVGNASQWQKVAVATIGNTLEPAYRGRYRAYAHLHVPSQPRGWIFSLDSVSAALPNAALASAQPIATVAGGSGQGTPGYVIADLGEITLPPTSSGMTQDLLMRLWAYPATGAPGFAATLSFGGLSLLPIDGAAGVLPRGLAQPTVLAGSPGRLFLDGINRRPVIGVPTGNIGSVYPQTVSPHYRGLFPVAGATTSQLTLMGGARNIASGATQPVVNAGKMFAAASVRYRPRFLFLKGV